MKQHERKDGPVVREHGSRLCRARSASWMLGKRPCVCRLLLCSLHSSWSSETRRSLSLPSISTSALAEHRVGTLLSPDNLSSSTTRKNPEHTSTLVFHARSHNALVYGCSRGLAAVVPRRRGPGHHRQHGALRHHLGKKRPCLPPAQASSALRKSSRFRQTQQGIASRFEGDYYVQNVRTGKYLYFDRPGDLTNLITGDERKPVQLGHDKSYGQSGRVWDHWEGTFVRGLNDKCMSAQWGEDQGVDVAGVSYACKVGPGSTGTDSLELAKQLWKLVPCGSGSGGDGAFTKAKTSDFKQLAAVEPKGDDNSGESKAAETATFEAKAPTHAAPTEQEEDSTPKETQAVDPKDRSTWVCRKDGKWLSEHPE